MTNNQPLVQEIFADVGLSLGRSFGSKTGYVRNHPGCRYFANAWIMIQGRGKVWGGDLDMATTDCASLVTVSRRLNRKLFVLREQVSSEPALRRQLIERAEATVWRGRVQFLEPDKKGAAWFWKCLNSDRAE